MQRFNLNSNIGTDFTIISFIFISVCSICLSCSTPRNYTFFKTLNKDTTIEAYVSQRLETKIQKNDFLSITVSSLNSEMDEKFNTAAKLISESNNSINTSTNYGFWVNNEGSIVLHLLGIYNVEGLTKNELAAKLEKDLLPFMKEPIVTVAFLNKKITVIGEVSTPKVLYMNKEEMNLIEVLVNSGDFKENAMIQDIMVIRDSADHKIIKHLNLEDHSIFTSSWYYIKADDIIYVKKDYSRYDKEERRRTLQTTISLVASTISLIVIIINSIFK